MRHQIRVEADPRLRLDKSPIYPYKLSAESVSPYAVNADSTTSTGFTWNSLDAPTGCILDRRMYIKATFTLDFTGTSTTSQLLNIGATDAIRAFPLSQIISSTKLVFNGRPYDAELSIWGEPLLRYANNQSYSEYECSSTGSFMDQFLRYEQFITEGDARNVLGKYGAGVYRTPRGGLEYTIDSNTATSAKVRVTITEPLFVTPLAFGEFAEKGISGVDTWSLNLRFINNPGPRFFSSATVAGRTITSVALSVNSDIPATLQYFALTPKEKVADISVLPYYNMVKNIFQMSSIGSGVEQAISAGNIILPSVPQRAYIYACKDVNDMTVTDTNTYLSLERISIGFDNVSGILANADKEQLYRISAQNGCEMTWPQWSKHVGSVFCVDFGKDISLRDGVVSGLEGRWSFNIRATFKNNYSNTVANPKLYIVSVHPGSLECRPGIIDQKEYLYEHGNVPKKGYKDVDDDFTDSYDGFYGSGVKDIAKKIGSVIKNQVIPSAKKIALAIMDNPDTAEFLLDAALDVIPGGAEARDLINTVLSLIPDSKKEQAKQWLRRHLQAKGGFYGGIIVETRMKGKRLVDGM